MTIATWAQLKTAVADWSHRSDLTTVIIDCVALCEARLNDMLLLKNMESDESLTLTLNQNYVALPTGFISPIKFWLVIDSERVELDPRLPQALPYYSDSAQPRLWAIDAANVRFDCPSDSAYSAKLRCIKASNLSDSSTTNYLLTKRPDVYLAGTLVEVARYTKDGEMFAMWEPKFLKACAEVKAAENRARGNVPLTTNLPGTSRRASILRGD